MGEYELYYFKIRGRSEFLRLLLNDLGLKYKEIDKEAEWATAKAQYPFGQLPALVDAGFQVVQSCAILRYLARKHDLYGTNKQEAARIDELIEGEEDLRNQYVKLIYQNYDEGKETFIKELPNKLAPFEKLLKASQADKTGFAVGNRNSCVDYNLFELLDILQVLVPDSLSTFPTLKAYYQKVLNRPNIKAYRATEGFKSRPINYNRKQ